MKGLTSFTDYQFGLAAPKRRLYSVGFSLSTRKFASRIKPLNVQELSCFDDNRETNNQRGAFTGTVDPFDDDTPLYQRKTENKKLQEFLTPLELETYGDDSPPDYTKMAILGKGRHCIVWIAKKVHGTSEDIVALK